jgi:hypothetical protein
MLHPAQIESYRRMTPVQKLEIAVQLWRAARALKAATLRAEHPDWSEDRVQAKVKEVFARARS